MFFVGSLKGTKRNRCFVLGTIVVFFFFLGGGTITCFCFFVFFQCFVVSFKENKRNKFFFWRGKPCFLRFCFKEKEGFEIF